MRPTKAIVIAAGQGRRLRPYTEHMPKCMVPVGDRPLLRHQLDAFRAHGIREFVVIRGYLGHVLEARRPELGPGDVRLVDNPGYQHNNILQSLFCAERELDGPVLVTYSDILFTADVVAALLGDPGDIALVIDRDFASIYEGRTQHPLDEAEVADLLIIIKTTGDKQLKDVPLAKVGGQGLFIKEIEEALLAGEVDLAIHSLKDMPAEMPAGCVLGAVPHREDWRDAFISNTYASLAEVPAGGKIGTGSLRRRVQILHRRPDLEVVHLRGNVDTRLRKLTDEGLDAIILAAAGLNRLGLGHLPKALLSEADMLPAISQGALGLEIRDNDPDMQEILAFRRSPAACR